MTVNEEAVGSPQADAEGAAAPVWVPREEWIKTQPQALIASCVMLLDSQGRMLLVRYAPGQPLAGDWWLPGGMLDHGEDPCAAAWRETHEEIGVELRSELRLIGIDHRVDVCGTGPVLDCFFDGGTLAEGTPIRLSPEHDQYAFVSLDELQDVQTAADVRTLTALHAAVTSGTAVCMREGVPVQGWAGEMGGVRDPTG
ncbi:NUDIX hydrolase [Streptomyces sp. Marseille-Q5077]|uniref:NUDIX hydrolase n=1 Tax=Streptomyces sp. Marseille-Q5077 TaxID=3418995 RepID=UPI003D024017